jgi:NitT/TauT family transport system substrate-binding protein
MPSGNRVKRGRLISRRQVLAGAAASAVLGLNGDLGRPARAARSAARSTAKFTLSLLPSGTNVFVFAARNKGFWKQRGIEVEISRGFGSAAAAQAVGTGKFEFGLIGAPSAIEQAALGIPLQSIATIQYDAAMGIVVLADSPIKTPADLMGRRLGATVSSGEFPYLRAFAKRSGFDLAKVQVVQLDSDARMRALAEQQVDAVSGLAPAVVAPLAADGVKTRFLPFADSGLRLYGLSLLTQPKLIDQEPELCQAVADGALEGLAFTLADPDAALAAFYQEVKEGQVRNRPAEVAIAMGMMQLTLFDDVAKRHGLGWHDPAKFMAMTELVAKYATPPGTERPDSDALFTNRFAGAVKLSTADWDAAQKRFSDYAQYLR